MIPQLCRTFIQSTSPKEVLAVQSTISTSSAPAESLKSYNHLFWDLLELPSEYLTRQATAKKR